MPVVPILKRSNEIQRIVEQALTAHRYHEALQIIRQRVREWQDGEVPNLPWLEGYISLVLGSYEELELKEKTRHTRQLLDRARGEEE